MSASSEEDERNRVTMFNMGLNLNLKATELRLGLPGSQSPERKPEGAGKKLRASSSGAKRGFSDLDQNGDLFSPSPSAANGAGGGNRPVGGPESGTPQSPVAGKKDVVPMSPEPVVPEKMKPEGGGGGDANGHRGFVAPSPKIESSVLVGWPPIPACRKNTMATNAPKRSEDAESKLGSSRVFVKVSMDGAPYLRKVDLKNYGSYMQLSSALAKMFSCFTTGKFSLSICLLNGSQGDSTGDKLSGSCLMDLHDGSECVLTYEDKDGDWMLVGDVPWDMFTDSCKRLRIMTRSAAVGLASCCNPKDQSQER